MPRRTHQALLIVIQKYRSLIFLVKQANGVFMKIMKRTWIKRLLASLLPAVCLLWASTAARAQASFYADKQDLLRYRDARGDMHPVKTAEQWQIRRKHILAGMEEVMGPLPSGPKIALDVKIIARMEAADYTRLELTYASSPGNRVPAYLFLPKQQPTQGAKLPAVLCLHPTHRELGKGVPAGLGPKKDRAYAVHLVKRGYVTLAPDYVHSGGYSFDPYKNGFVSATMLGIWNHIRAVDLLQARPEVDPQRIGVIGHSLGGHNSMYVAAFDERIRCIVSNCGFCSFPTYMKGKLAGWSHQGYMPLLRTKYELDPKKVPFDFPEVVAALAPRAFLASAPIRDHNFEVEGVKECIRAAEPVYKLLGASEKLAANYPDCDHNFPPDVRDVAYRWLDRWLKN